MAEPVPDATSQQQAQQVGEASPIFAEEAGQIEPPHKRGSSVIPRAPGTSPSDTQQADSAPETGGGSSPVPDAQTQGQQASASGGVATCAAFSAKQFLGSMQRLLDLVHALTFRAARGNPVRTAYGRTMYINLMYSMPLPAPCA